MSPKIKGLISDFVRAGSIIAAVLVIVVSHASDFHVPAGWVAGIAVTAGVVNALVGFLRPYAAAKLKGTK